MCVFIGTMIVESIDDDDVTNINLEMNSKFLDLFTNI